MENLLCIQPYKQEDEPYCKELAASGFIALLNSTYCNLTITSYFFQSFFTLFACNLYWSDISFPYYLIYPLIIAFAVYIILYLLFWKIVQDPQKEIFNATRNCNVNGDKCFWVAEAYYYRSLKCFRPYLRYTRLTETELQKSNINISDYDKKIVGFIGVDENVRLRNCALLNKFLVHNDYTRKGTGTQLIKTVVLFCDEKKYTRVNLQFFDFLTYVLNVSKKLDFKYYETQSKLFFLLVSEIKIHEFSYQTNITKPTLNINNIETDTEIETRRKTKTEIEIQIQQETQSQPQFKKKCYLKPFIFCKIEIF
ncbi:PREDICTED: uncharacterized protein LOC106784203 [Polistes canadensis]|uniref:uncharacterized protein LOC106784203 n=1 Tax=Polistes canadensis TaxID=91411 RepID=UPI000718F8FF|nr:PREDICTED: uncharacterized protein LOC106784203 [Polistes canadensis]